MSFDPAMTATQLAVLVARSDDRSFQLKTASSTFLSGTSAVSFFGANSKHPYQDYFAPNTSSVIAISWTATYRGEKWQGPPLYVDLDRSLIGTAAALDAASKFLDLLDLRASRDGANPNTYAPTGRGP